MATWGKAKLSPAVLRYIEGINNGQEEEELDGIQRKLLLATGSSDVQDHSCGSYGLLNDWPETPESVAPISSQERVEEMEIAPPTVDPQLLATNIVKQILTGLDSINVVIELVSNLCDRTMDEVVVNSWSLLHEDDHKKSFIIAMSATRNSAASVSSTVLLPLFSSDDTCHNALSSFGTVLGWLECSISKSLVVPMLSTNSPITRDMSYCKAFFAALTEAQRTDALISWSQCVQNELLPQFLQPLSMILELPVDVSAAPHMAKMLSACIDKFSQDRLMGKILLSLITLLTPSTPPQVFHDVSSLASHFKGPLRFRHKQALDKLLNQLS